MTKKKKKANWLQVPRLEARHFLFSFFFLSFKVWLNPKDCKGDSYNNKIKKKKKKVK
jgi:hypothetical protein